MIVVTPSPEADEAFAAELGAHVRPLLDAASAERLGLVLLAQGRRPFTPLPIRVCVTIIGDDPKTGSLGPDAFHSESVKQLMRGVFSIAIISCEPLARIYRDAATLAHLGLSSVIVETAPEHEAAWIAFANQAAPGRLRFVARVRPGWRAP